MVSYILIEKLLQQVKEKKCDGVAQNATNKINKCIEPFCHSTAIRHQQQRTHSKLVVWIFFSFPDGSGVCELLHLVCSVVARKKQRKWGVFSCLILLT